MEDLKCCLLGLESASFHRAFPSVENQDDLQDEGIAFSSSSESDGDDNDHEVAQENNECPPLQGEVERTTQGRKDSGTFLTPHGTSEGHIRGESASFSTPTALHEKAIGKKNIVVSTHLSGGGGSHESSLFESSSLPSPPYFPQFVLSSLYHSLLHPVELEMLQQLLPLGSAYAALSQFVKDASVGRSASSGSGAWRSSSHSNSLHGLYVGAVAAGMQDILHQYYIPDVQNLCSPSGAARLHQRYQMTFSLCTEMIRTGQEMRRFRVVQPQQQEESTHRSNTSFSHVWRVREEREGNRTVGFSSPSTPHCYSDESRASHSSIHSYSILYFQSLHSLLHQLHHFISHREVPIEFREAMGRRVWMAVLYAIAHFVAHGVVLRSHASDFFIRLRPRRGNTHVPSAKIPSNASSGWYSSQGRCQEKQDEKEEEEDRNEEAVVLPSLSPKDKMELVLLPRRLPIGLSVELGMSILQAGRERRLLLMEAQLGTDPTSMGTRSSFTNRNDHYHHHVVNITSCSSRKSAEIIPSPAASSGYLESLAFSAEDQVAQWMFEKIFSPNLLTPLAPPQKHPFDSCDSSPSSVEQNSKIRKSGGGGKMDIEQLASRIHEVKSFWSGVLWSQLTSPSPLSSSPLSAHPSYHGRRRERSGVKKEILSSSSSPSSSSSSSSSSWALRDRMSQVQDLFFFRRGDVWGTFIHLILSELWEGVSPASSTFHTDYLHKNEGPSFSWGFDGDGRNEKEEDEEEEEEEGGEARRRRTKMKTTGIRTVISLLATGNSKKNDDWRNRKREEEEENANPMMKVLPGTSSSSSPAVIAFTPSLKEQPEMVRGASFSPERRSTHDVSGVNGRVGEQNYSSSCRGYNEEPQWIAGKKTSMAATPPTTFSPSRSRSSVWWWFSPRQRRSITEAFQTALRQVGWTTIENDANLHPYTSRCSAGTPPSSLSSGVLWSSSYSTCFPSSSKDSFILYIPENLEEDEGEKKESIKETPGVDEEEKREMERKIKKGGKEKSVPAEKTSSDGTCSGSIEEAARHFLARVKGIQLQYIPCSRSSTPSVSYAPPSSPSFLGSISLSGGGVPLIITPPAFMYYQRIFQFLFSIHISMVALQSLRPSFSEAMTFSNHHPSKYLRQALGLYHLLYYVLHTVHQYIQVDVVDVACRGLREQLLGEEDHSSEQDEQDGRKAGIENAHPHLCRKEEKEEETKETSKDVSSTVIQPAFPSFRPRRTSHTSRDTSSRCPPSPQPGGRGSRQGKTSSGKCRSLEDAQRCHHQCLWKILQGTFLADTTTPPPPLNSSSSSTWVSESDVLRQACEALCQCACTFVVLCQRYRMTSWAVDVPSYSPSAKEVENDVLSHPPRRQVGAAAPPTSVFPVRSPPHGSGVARVGVHDDESIATIQKENTARGASCVDVNSSQRVVVGNSMCSSSFHITPIPTKEQKVEGEKKIDLKKGGHQTTRNGDDGNRATTIILQQRGNMLVRETPMEVKACLALLQTQLHQRVISVFASFLSPSSGFLSTTPAALSSPLLPSSVYPSPMGLSPYRALWTRLDFNRFFSHSAFPVVIAKTVGLADIPPCAPEEDNTPTFCGVTSSSASSRCRAASRRGLARSEGRNQGKGVSTSVVSSSSPSSFASPVSSSLSKSVPASYYPLSSSSSSTLVHRSHNHTPSVQLPLSEKLVKKKASQVTGLAEEKEKKKKEKKKEEEEITTTKSKKEERKKNERMGQWRSEEASSVALMMTPPHHHHQSSLSASAGGNSPPLHHHQRTSSSSSFVGSTPSSFAALLAVAAAGEGGAGNVLKRSEEKKRPPQSHAPP